MATGERPSEQLPARSRAPADPGVCRRPMPVVDLTSEIDLPGRGGPRAARRPERGRDAPDPSPRSEQPVTDQRLLRDRARWTSITLTRRRPRRRCRSTAKILIAGGFGVGQDHAGRRDQRDPAAAHRGARSATAASASTTSRASSARRRPRWPWTSAGSASGPTWCCTCSARPARNASGSCGTSWPTARSAPWCWPTPAGSPTASPPSTTSSEHGTPFVVAVNCFDGAPRYDPEDVRIALSLDPEVPVVLCDARDRDSVKRVLVNLVRYVRSWGASVLIAPELPSAGAGGSSSPGPRRYPRPACHTPAAESRGVMIKHGE